MSNIRPLVFLGDHVMPLDLLLLYLLGAESGDLFLLEFIHWPLCLCLVSLSGVFGLLPLLHSSPNYLLRA